MKESLVPLKDYAALISDLITDLEAFFNQFSDESVRHLKLTKGFEEKEV